MSNNFQRWLGLAILTLIAVLLPGTGWAQQKPAFTFQPSPESRHEGYTADPEQIKPGVVIEKVYESWEGARAGLKEGDVLLSWSRGDSHGTIDSPFTLWWLEFEQRPQGAVSIQGTRGPDHQVWTMGPDYWGLETRPDLPPGQLSLHEARRQMILAGKLKPIARLWEEDGWDKTQPLWLRSWMALQVGKMFAASGQWQQADEAFGAALILAEPAGPCVTPPVRRAWARSFESRGDRTGASQQYEQQLADVENHRCGKHAAVGVLLSLAINHVENGDLSEAGELAHRIIFLDQDLSPGSINRADAFGVLTHIAYLQGDLDKMESYAKDSQGLLEKIGPANFRFSDALIMLGLVAGERGDFARSEVLLRRALALEQKVASKSLKVSDIISNLGNVALYQGDLLRAEFYTRQAIAIRQSSTVPSRALGVDFVTLCSVLAEQDRLFEAGRYCRHAGAMLAKVSGGNNFLPFALENTGDVLRAQGRLPEAAAYMRRALALQQKVSPDNLQIADNLHLLGRVTEDLGDLDKAAEYYRRALTIREKLAPGSTFHAETLAAIAGIMRRKGQLDQAASYYAQALDALDSQAARLGGSQETRVGFRASHESYYRDYIDLLLRQNQLEAALAVLERSRARSMLETLAAAHVDVRQGADPALIERERSLQATLKAKSERRIRLLSDKHSNEQIQAIEKEIGSLTLEYQDLESQIRSSSPGYAALTQPQPLSAHDIQRHLLDPDTLLLEYSLGEERSYVFALTPNSLSARELPKRKEIEQTARQVYRLLTARNHRIPRESETQRSLRLARTEAAYNQAAAKLSRMVLAPVGGMLQNKRLLIIADGALHFIPFAALPEPEGMQTTKRRQVPLVLDHEIVNLPSASVLAVLRQEQARRQAAPKAVAVLADPVFSRSDTRVQQRSSVNPAGTNSGSMLEQKRKDKGVLSDFPGFSAGLLTRSAADIGFGRTGAALHFSRLPFTRREADAIMAVTPDGQGMRAVDFDANRNTATSPELAQYRIVHFATHGLLDSTHPELSGLVLSLVDKRGKRQDGFLQLGDIYNLNLPADLVVLSACETGLGKVVNGEGLIGLTRGFMYAGATRVVSTLWKVDDFATAKLMKAFYQAMEQDGRRPAQALREAQFSMLNNPRWSSPYYWAGFTIQGEWK